MLVALAHRIAISLFDGYEDEIGTIEYRPLVRDENLLAAALATQRWHYYPTVLDKAGALLRSIVKDHPFIDGNKRLGLAATFVFLALNRYVLVATNAEMVRFALVVASTSPALRWEEVAEWIALHAVPIPADRESLVRSEPRLSTLASDDERLRDLLDLVQRMGEVVREIHDE